MARNRLKLNEQDRQQLAELLAEVPQRTVVHYDWTSEKGRQFVKTARELQMSGVAAPSMAEQLDLSQATLNGALRYWSRPTKSRGSRRRQRRQSRPLRTNEEKS